MIRICPYWFSRVLVTNSFPTLVPNTHLVALKVVTSEGDGGGPKLVWHSHPIFPPTKGFYTRNQRPFSKPPRGGVPPSSGSLGGGSGPLRGGRRSGGSGPPGRGGPLGRGNGPFGGGGLLECIGSGPTRISLEPWYPLWYPVLLISVPTIIFTQKSLSYLIYSIGTNLDAHVRVLKKGHFKMGGKFHSISPNLYLWKVGKVFYKQYKPFKLMNKLTWLLKWSNKAMLKKSKCSITVYSRSLIVYNIKQVTSCWLPFLESDYCPTYG